MTEKAKELIEKFLMPIDELHKYPMCLETAKQCAIICVDEIINASPTNPLTGGYIELYSDMIDEAIEFWQTVKQEIINYK